MYQRTNHDDNNKHEQQRTFSSFVEKSIQRNFEASALLYSQLNKYRTLFHRRLVIILIIIVDTKQFGKVIKGTFEAGYGFTVTEGYLNIVAHG